MQDLPIHKGARKKLVEEIKKKGISEEKVLAAIGKIPRHVFFDSLLWSHAYEDKAFPIAAGQTISQPFTVAFQSSLLEIEPGEKVLEVGTGSGYQCIVLLELGAKVFTIERQKVLYDEARRRLPEMGYNPKFVYGDGYKGLPSFAPFDKIIVTAGAPFIPEELLKQLRIGGRMVIPVGEKIQVMTLVIKVAENKYVKEEFGEFRFVPLLKKKE